MISKIARSIDTYFNNQRNILLTSGDSFWISLHVRGNSEVIKVRVVTVDVSSIGIKFENFMQAGCRDLGSQPCTAESPLCCPNWYSFLEHF